MNIHEYQAKELLAKFGVPVPAGYAAMSVEEAVAAAAKLPGPLYVVKAQIHAGGRGKGKFKELGPDAKGGVRLARTLDEVRAAAAEMLGNTLVTIQTGPAGKQVNRLYVTDGVDIAKEFYLALLVDRKSGRIAMVVSTEGGMDIEDGRPRHAREDHDASRSIRRPASCRITAAPSPSRSGSRATSTSRRRRSRSSSTTPSSAPTPRRSRSTRSRSPTTASCSCSTPRSASIPTPMFRHPDLEALRDESEEDPMEVEASKYDLAYIKLDGNIGCMVNGAGLAMATMDIIKLNGAFPANFLRRRRRRLQGEGDRGVQDHPLRSGGEGHPRQHLRRDHALRHHRRGHRRRGAGRSTSRCRWSSGSKAPMSRRASASSPTRGLADRPADDLGDAARKIVAEVKVSGVSDLASSLR